LNDLGCVSGRRVWARSGVLFAAAAAVAALLASSQGAFAMTETARVAATSTGPTAIAVPAIPGSPRTPHETYAGANITLKGIARNADRYKWDFGDGTSTAWLTVGNAYDLGVTHAYSGAVGRLYVATLSVENAADPSTVSTASYPIEIMESTDLADPAQLDVRARMAEENALWYLHVNESRSTFVNSAPGWGQPYGTWQGSSAFSVGTCDAVDALEKAGHLPKGDPDTDPYVEDVQEGLAYILANATQLSIPASRENGVEDINSNGIALRLSIASGGNEITNHSGCALALADSLSPNAVATTGQPTIVYGRSYAAIAQDATEYLAFAQNGTSGGFPTSTSGSWGYRPQDGVMSDPGYLVYPISALRALSSEMGATVPTVVPHLLPYWLASSRHSAFDVSNGAWSYSPGGNDYLSASPTAGGILGHLFLGDSVQHPDVKAGLGFLYRDWNDVGANTWGCWTANLGNTEAMYAVSQAMTAARLSQVNDYDYLHGTLSSNSFDWYYTPAGQSQKGEATDLVQRQQTNGSWSDTTGCGAEPAVSATAKGAVVLEKGAAPVADAGGPYVTDLNTAVHFDASASYSRTELPLTYAWDFDYDGSSFTVDATGVTATDQSGFASYTADANGNPNGVLHSVALRVSDSAGNQSISVVHVTVKPPPHPPVVVLAPVSASAGHAVHLDASQSYDVDGDPITYGWDFAGNNLYADATGAAPTWTFAMTGTYAVCVKATDHPDQNATPYNAPSSSRIACELVSVTNGPPPPTANAGGPYTATAGASIALDGTQSSSSDGSSLSYAWDLNADGLYTDSTSATPTFTVPSGSAVGTKLTVCLKVSGGGGTSVPSCTDVTVISQPQPPVCQIVAPVIVVDNTGATQSVTLDGSRSSDPNGAALTFRWTADAGTLNDPTAAVAQLTFGPTPGNYTISYRLAVSNATLTSTCDGTVSVLVRTPPTFTVSPQDVRLEIDPSLTANVLAWLAAPQALQPAQPAPTTAQMTNDFVTPTAWIPGTTTRVTWTATDDYGNTAQRSANLTVVDTRPPVLTLPSDITTGATVVTYDATANDYVSGVVPVTCSPASGSAFPAGKTTVNCSAADASGNTATGSFTVNVNDSTPPVITPTATGAQGDNGWYIGDVALSWSVVDSDSGLTSEHGCDAVTVTTDTTGTDYTCSATSGGGTAAQTVTIKRDTTLPRISHTLTPPANAAGWNSSDVTATFACDDGAGSGIATCPAPVKFGEGTAQTAAATAKDRAGNTAADTVSAVNVDETAPTLAGDPTSPPNADGWYKGDVAIHWTCADAGGSGIAGACPADSTIAGEGTNLTATESVSDVAGNTTAAKSSAVKIDRTPPHTDASAPSGWSNAGVIVTLSAADNLSGVAATRWSLDGSATQTGTSISIADEGVHTLVFWSIDKAGNAEDHESVQVLIDKTAPTITHTLVPLPNGAGWNNTSVKVTFLCDDPLSGIATCGPTQVVTTEGRAQLIIGKAIDKATNSAEDTVPVSIDETPPTITGKADRDPNANGWYDADVLVGFTCGDALSGVVACPAPVRLGEGKSQSVLRSASDAADNVAHATVGGINVDETAPVVTYTGAAATYTAEQTVNITCQASDALSGIASTTCANITGPAWSFGLGTTSRSASATDRAGNQGTASVSFTVGVTCSSLKALIGSWVTDPDVASSLQSKIDALCAATTPTAKRGKLGAFDNEVDAQTGKSITADRSVLLKQLAATL
jgi:hypothetical protein